MPLEDSWGLVKLWNLKATPWQLKEPRAVVARHLMLAGGEALPLPFQKNRSESLKLTLYVLRGDVGRDSEPLTDVLRVPVSSWVVGNVRRMQELLEKHEVVV